MWKIDVGLVRSVMRKTDRLEKGNHLCKSTMLALLSKGSKWTYLVLFPSSGNRYLLVVVNCFTKWVEAFPLRNPRAKTIARVFVNQVISRHGVPFELHTDQGRNFESKIFQELMCLLGIKKTRTTPLYPQFDGQVERQHRTINYLSKYISENQKDWDEWILMCLLACRTSKHESTGATPAELYFARDLRLPLDLLQGRKGEI